MTLDDWLLKYHEKTKEYPNSFPGSDFVFDAERGFCVSIPDGSTLIIGEVCGDGRYWLAWLTTMAKELGCNKLRFWTTRNPAAFIRKFGFTLAGFSDGHYVLEKEVFE